MDRCMQMFGGLGVAKDLPLNAGSVRCEFAVSVRAQ